MKAAHARGLAGPAAEAGLFRALFLKCPQCSLCMKSSVANETDRASEIYHLLQYLSTLKCEINVETLIHKYNYLKYSHEQNMSLMLISPRSQVPLQTPSQAHCSPRVPMRSSPFPLSHGHRGSWACRADSVGIKCCQSLLPLFSRALSWMWLLFEQCTSAAL